MVSVSRQNTNSCVLRVLYLEVRLLNCYYASYSGDKRVLNFMRNLKLAHILVQHIGDAGRLNLWSTIQYFKALGV